MLNNHSFIKIRIIKHIVLEGAGYERIPRGSRLDAKGSREDPAGNETLTAENILLKESLTTYQKDIEGYKENIKALNNEERHNQTLINNLDKAEWDKEDLKITYSNYFAQVQTLINQKAIEAPGNKKSILSRLKFW